MNKSLLIVMLDVMVLSVLSLTHGQRAGTSGFLLPVYEWSKVIEKGLAQEQTLRAEIGSWRDRAAQAEERAARAEALLDRQLALQDDAQRRLAAAADVQQLLREELERARLAAGDSGAQVRQADEQRRAAEAQAAAARQEQVRAEERAQAAAAQADEARRQQQQAEAQVQAERQAADAVRREAAQAAARVTAADDALRRAAERTDDQQKTIELQRDRLIALSVQMQKAEMETAAAETQRAALAEQLDRIEQERSRSVWVQRDRALAGCAITLIATDQTTGDSRVLTDSVSLPVVSLGGALYAVGDFQSLGLNWSQVQADRDLTTAQYRLFNLTAAAAAEDAALVGPILSFNAAPPVCLLPIPPASRGVTEGALTPATMAYIKENRLQTALAFSPANPDRSLPVSVTPAVAGPFLVVKPVPGKALFSRRLLNPGDYLLTENGRFIGVMVSADRCYVLEESLPPEVALIPLAREVGSVPYARFVAQAREVHKAIRLFLRQL